MDYGDGSHLPSPAHSVLYSPKSVPRRAILSFDNLVALANDQERLRDARKMVWRDRGEPAVALETFRQCLVHALKGGLRAGSLAFGIRAGFNVFVLAFRILRLPRQFRMTLIRNAIFGEDSFRFAAMIGSYVALYKYLLNALPLVHRPFPAMNILSPPSHHPTFDEEEDDVDTEHGILLGVPESVPVTRRLSSQAQAHLNWVRKRTKRWHAIFAGAVAGGVGIMFERKRRRVNIAQQLFVRGLQGSYNEFSAKHNIKIPFGSVIVFALCCGQIMYAFLLRPDTIPPAYSSWIQTASRTVPQTISMNRELVRNGRFNTEDVEWFINAKGTVPAHRRRLLERLARARDFNDFGPRYAPCEAVHPTVQYCCLVPFDRFMYVFRWMLPVYGALHFIPLMLFKRKQFIDRPGSMISRATFGSGRSATFLSFFVIIYQTYFCIKHRLHSYLTAPGTSVKLPRYLVDLLISKGSFWLGGLLCGLSLFIEAKQRRPELAMYVLPKGLESMWRMAKGKGFVFGPRKYGEGVLCAIGMGMVMNTYQHNPQHLSSIVRRILYQFIGPN